ncbi:MAG: aminopeptidase P family protein [Lachnospiraceae bacterium]|nr:aminopeptidase P family protein [Robinsoniella sp.]MDY3767407.1 aminopeptidase P family protein [Lachnospiraceae bacterium]
MRYNREKIAAVIGQKNVDAILVSDSYNIRHISQFRGEGYLYLTKNRQVILTDSRYTTQAKGEAEEFEVFEINNDCSYEKLLSNLMEEDGVEKVGFEDQHIGYAEYERWTRQIPGKTWIEMGESLNDLRMIKEQWELDCLEKAESIGDAAFSHILNVIKPGMTELAIAAELEYFMKQNGASGTSFDTIIASGLNSAMPHAIPSDKKIEEGDFVTMDFGCKYNGYCSDMTRTIVVGKASEKQREIYSIVLEAQLAALDALRPGLTGQEVDKVARDIIEKAGYGAYFGHGLGHSVGLFIHESPRLSPKGMTLMQENMIQTVEPGIYLPGFGGVRIEDMVVVTADGHKNFAHSKKELIEL